MLATTLKPLLAIAAAASDPERPSAVRALLAPLADAGGTIERRRLEGAVAALERVDRRAASALGVRIGTMDLFHPGLLKPEPVRWRLALAAIWDEAMMPPCPPAGAVSVNTPDTPAVTDAYYRAGFRTLGPQMLRIDMVERLARIAHDARPQTKGGRTPFVPEPALAVSLGLQPASFAQLMLAFGFHPAGAGGTPGWVWRGPRVARPRVEPPRPGNAFGALAALRAANG
jgi:ATP-dependent RNA helicase SUPV3L1/SUV3